MTIKFKDKYSLVALLPMKANSERIKGKNFKSFCGKPLFRWVLDTLLSVSEIEKVIINTDARKILSENGLVDSEKVVIRDRKPEICGDYVSMNEIIDDDIKNFNSDLYLMTHTTNPFLSKKSIEKSINAYKKGLLNKTADSLFTVNKMQERFYNSNVTPLNHDPAELIRTQDLEPWYVENSNLYIFTKDSFAATKARIGSNPLIFETPPDESIDIDTQNDWDFAEVMIDFYRKKGRLR